MELNWLESIFLGLIGGISELLPISSQAHQRLFLFLVGGEQVPFLRLCTHLGALLALLVACNPLIARMRRERKIASVPPRRRRRQPDVRCLRDIKVLRTAVMPVLLSIILYFLLQKSASSLWLIAILLVVNGILLYAPRLMSSGNKESLAMAPLDSILMGMGAALGALPGISRVGACTSIGLMRGCQRQYSLDMALLLSIPALILWLVFDCVGLVMTLSAVTFMGVLKGLVAGCFAFGGAYLSTFLMRFLAVRIGYSEFAYYSWGLALLSFILYLTI